MGLAFLTYLGIESGSEKFRADIGNNAFYCFEIGQKIYSKRGLKMIDHKTFKSPVKMLSNGGHQLETSFFLDVPQELFKEGSQYIQLFSYKTQSLMSPAISDVVRINPQLIERDFRLPKIMSYQTEAIENRNVIPTHSEPFAIHEAKLSESMFLNAILGSLPAIIGKGLPLLNSLIPASNGSSQTTDNPLSTLLPLLGNATNGNSNGSGVATPTSSNKDMMKIILTVVQNLLENKDNTQAQSASSYTSSMAIDPSTLMQLAPLLEKVLSPETISAIGDNPVKLLKAVADSALKLQKMEFDHLEKINPGVEDATVGQLLQGMSLNHKATYSKAKIAPALLAALPALMPLLQNLLNPETIKAIGEAPMKLFKAISDAGLQHQKQELDHLERINPGVDDPDILPLLNSMSIHSSANFGVQSKYSDQYSIQFTDTNLLKVSDKQKLFYAKSQKIRFPIIIKSKDSNPEIKHIPKAILQVVVQDSLSMRVLLEKNFKRHSLPLNQLTNEIVIDVQELENLPANSELKLEVTLLWKDSKGRTKGTFMNHYFHLAERYLFLKDSGKAESSFSLNDVNAHRSFWHKVWEGSPSTHERWEVNFECKYYTKLSSTKKPGVGKLETRRLLVSDSNSNGEEDQYRRKIDLKLKSGMSVDLSTVNLLLEGSGFEKLIPAKLQAFYDQEFISNSGNMARVSVGFRGRKNETATLWVYPGGHFQRYKIGQVEGVNPYGMVTSYVEEEVVFPQFTSINFIGTQSE